MNEAITMAGNLCDVLNYGTIVQPDMTEDDGADYRIMVTDTAGNVAEVRFDHELGRWTSEEGFDRDAAVFRLGEIRRRATQVRRLPERCPVRGRRSARP